MRGLSFAYHDFYDFYKRQGSPTEDVIVHVLESDYVAMKYDRTGARSAFRQRNMSVRKIDREELSDAAFAPLGVFVVHSAVVDPRKCLYMVCPSMHSDHEQRPVMCMADHYSFVVNKGSQRPLHFHKTKYLPLNVLGEEGRVAHVPSHLPLSFDAATRERFQSMLHADLRPDARFLWTLFGKPQEESRGDLIGGARRRRRRVRRRVMQQPPEPGAGNELSLDDIFRRLPLHRVLIMAVRRSRALNTADVTVILHDRLRHELDLRRAFVLQGVPMNAVLQNGSLSDALQAMLVERLAPLEWDDFYDVVVEDEP